MDQRLPYAVGDFLASLVIGMAAGLVSWLIVSPAWNMWVAMFAMMPLGMVVGLVLYFPVAGRLGAMEAMIPAMYAGMWGGMVVGMMSAMVALPLRHALEMGAACGIGEIVFLWIANGLLRGAGRRKAR
ncbi:MAG: hypothetical protein WCY29_09295 [Novosphingobium sp.]